jgi:ribosomal protein S6
MFIFPERFKEDELDGVIKTVRAEVEKLGGEVISSTRLGRRTFARPIRKMEQGHYAVATFRLDSQRLPSLHARFRLSEDVLRVQVVRAQPAPVVEG